MTPHDGDVCGWNRRGSVWIGVVNAASSSRSCCASSGSDCLKKASLLDKATLYACTALGGDFGFSGNIAAVESGGLTGLIKSLHMEFAHNLEKASN